MGQEARDALQMAKDWLVMVGFVEEGLHGAECDSLPSWGF